jgi:methyl-accepting chemotaxis protein
MPVAVQPAKYVHFSDKMTESLMNINRVVQENKKTLDSIQDMAVELTRAIRSLEAVAVKYIKMADQVLDKVVPLLSKLPIVGDEVREFATDAQALANKIVAACELAERVLPGVEAGLTTADMNKLQTSTGQVQQLTKSLQGLMPAGR